MTRDPRPGTGAGAAVWMTVEEWVALQERLGMVGDAPDGAALRAEIEERLRDADARLAERAWRGMVERRRQRDAESAGS